MGEWLIKWITAIVVLLVALSMYLYLKGTGWL